LTFLSGIIAGDSWGQISLPLIEVKPWVAAPIILGAFLSVQLGLVNVIAAVIVDRQAQAREDDQKLLHRIQEEELHASYKRLMHVFGTMDEDGSGCLTLQELLDSYDKHPAFREILDLMDIAKQDLPLVFGILDEDQSGDVSFKEFVKQLHTMKNFNTHTALMFIKHYAMEIHQAIRGPEESASEEQQGSVCSSWGAMSQEMGSLVFGKKPNGSSKASPKHAKFKPEPPRPASQPDLPRLEDPGEATHAGDNVLRIEVADFKQEILLELQSFRSRVRQELEAATTELFTKRTSSNGGPADSMHLSALVTPATAFKECGEVWAGQPRSAQSSHCCVATWQESKQSCVGQPRGGPVAQGLNGDTQDATLQVDDVVPHSADDQQMQNRETRERPVMTAIPMDAAAKTMKGTLGSGLRPELQDLPGSLG